MWSTWKLLYTSFLLLLWPSIATDYTETKSTGSKLSPTKQPTYHEQIPMPSREILALHAISLTSKTFGSSVGDGNVWLIEFYTPWCKHCQEFANSYNNVAATFHSSPKEGIRVAKVDCEMEKALKTRFGVTSFPSFFLVDGWSVYEFENNRSEATLMDFARGGYKKQQRIPYYISPMGPMGLLQGAFIYLGSKAIDFFHSVQASSGASPLLAGLVLSFFAVVGGMISVVALAILTTPKAKDD